MEGSSESPSTFSNPLTGYLQTLQRCKTSIPHGQLVCVSVSPSVTSTSALLRLAATVGPHIAVLQVHADIIDDWSVKTVRRLTYLAKVYGFLIWEGGRILNNQTGLRGRNGGVSREKAIRDVDLARKRYTKGVVNVASWAGLASSWMIVDEEADQGNGTLIPTLKQAARETIAAITSPVRTEITAGADAYASDAGDRNEEDEDDEDEDEAVHTHESNNGNDGLRPALPMRKESFIALTRTITQRSESSLSSRPSTADNGHDNADQGMGFEIIARPLRPPVLVRGLVLSLLAKDNSAFTTRYRKSCLAAAQANQDFVIGFITEESWVDSAGTEDLLDDDDEENGDSEEHEDPFIVFFPLETEDVPRRSSEERTTTTDSSSRHLRHLSDADESHGNGTATPTPHASREPHRPELHSSLSARAVTQAAVLNRLVGRALEIKENSITNDTRRQRRQRRSPDILSIPVITMAE